jgi:mycothiol synthase
MDVTVLSTLTPSDRSAVQTLLDRASAADGHYALSDDAWMAFSDGNVPDFAGLLGTQSDHDHLVGYGQVTRAIGDGSWTIHTVLDPHHRFGAIDDACSLIAAALSHIDAHGGGDVQYWVSHPSAAHDDMAIRFGFTRGRDLLQMRVDLPLAERTELATRPFRVSVDEDAWVRVNNRAFAWHPEQGGWTVDGLRRREAESWFDPDGFLVHEIDGAMAGFCWTKVHRDPVAMGEIYVIAVDPDASGRGLGRALTVAGLASLHAKGLTVGMLYVDADNTNAVRLYDKLGFRVNHVNRAYRTTRVGNVS